jgi:TAT-translocated FGD2 family F420-dependent dehydrogenase
MVSVGFVLSDEQFVAPELVEYGAAAENAGFDMIWISDHFHPWQDNQGHSGLAWITLGALGQRVKRVPMGTGVTCPTYRYNPAIVAQGFATLGMLYPGRIWLGVGSGEAVNEWPTTGEWASYKERSQRMAEAITIIRRLWGGDWVTYLGDYYQVASAKLYDVPEQAIPIYVAASGKKSMYLAGLHGDGVISDAKSLKKAEGKKGLEDGAKAGGKNADQLALSVESFVFVGKKKDANVAAEKWRFGPKAFTEYLDNPDPRDIQRRAEVDIPLEQVLEGWVIGEDPQVHIDAIQKLVDDGITNIFIHSAQEDQHMVIDFYGEQVLPKVKHQTMQLHSLESDKA